MAIFNFVMKDLHSGQYPARAEKCRGQPKAVNYRLQLGKGGLVYRRSASYDRFAQFTRFVCAQVATLFVSNTPFGYGRAARPIFAHFILCEGARSQGAFERFLRERTETQQLSENNPGLPDPKGFKKTFGVCFIRTAHSRHTVD